MVIVIIGEFSGFAKNLKKGIQSLGHEAFVYSWGDGFKRINAGTNSYTVAIDNYSIFGLTIKGSNRIRKVFSAVKLKNHVKKHWSDKKADAVIILNPAFVKNSNTIYTPYFSREMVLSMTISKSNIFLSACGNDYIYNRYLPNCRKVNEYAISKYYMKDKDKQLFYSTLDFAKKVIPVMADYALAYRYYKNEFNYEVLPTIPLPFDVYSVDYNNVIKDRVVIMHGITRPHEKGSYLILSALEKIKSIYSDKVDIRIVKKLPLSQYLDIMNEANIIIDQCYSSSYGMNAIEALSMGKVVLSGNDADNLREFGIDSSPIINIEPNVEMIFRCLEELVNNPEKIKKLSRESRDYALKLHHSSLIAQKYIALLD